MEHSDKKDEVVAVRNLGKTYRVWRDPSARLKAPLVERARKLIPFRKDESVPDSNLENEGSRIVNRNRYYYDFRALKGVDLTLCKGDSIGIIGRNGSGKSTLLQLIAGTLTPTDGTVKTQGRVAALLELGAGFNDEFTGRENVYMNGSILGLSKAEIDERFDRIAEFANIGEFMEQPIKTYSSGMRVRLAFAVQAEVDPDILIVDEALAVGDIRFTMKCIRRMRELVEKGTTLIFVSHDLGSIVNFCKEVIWIHDGCIFRRGKPREVTLEYSNFMHYGELTQPGDQSTLSEVSQEGQTGRQTDRIVSAETWVDLTGFPADGNRDAIFRKAVMEINGIKQGSPILEGGEKVRFRLQTEVMKSVSDPLVCADIYDSKGNLIFGVNSCFEPFKAQTLEAGKWYEFEFNLVMPKLKNGDYTVLFGLSSGDYHHHTHIYGITDCLNFKIRSQELAQRHHIVRMDGLGVAMYPIS